MGDSDFFGRLFGQSGPMRSQRDGTRSRPWEQRNIAGVSGANQSDFAPGNPGLWTPGPAGSQTYHPLNLGGPNLLNPDVTGWNRQSSPQLFWPDRDVNQFPVWPYSGSSPSVPPGVPPPGGGTTPPPGGTIPPGSPPGTSPGASGPQPGPSTGEGSTGAGGDMGMGNPAPSGLDAPNSDAGPYSGGIATPVGNFFGNVPGVNYSFSLAPGIGSGAFGRGVNAISDALGLSPTVGQTGSFLGNLAVSVFGTPLAGIINSALGSLFGTGQLSQQAQTLNTARSFDLGLFGPRGFGLGVDPPGVGGQIGIEGLDSPTGPVGVSGVTGLSPGQIGNIGVTGQTGIGLSQEAIDAMGMTSGPPGGGEGGEGPGNPGGEGVGGGAGTSGAGPGDPGGPFHRGGMIPNRGTSQLETVPIKAKEGEFVVRPEAARKFAPILEWINNAPSQASPEHLIRLIAMAKTMDQHRGRSV